MLGQTIARHFAEVFFYSVWSLFDSIFYLLRKKSTIFFSFISGFNSFQILQRNRPVLTRFETGLSGANLQEFRGYDLDSPYSKQENESDRGRAFLAWKENISDKDSHEKTWKQKRKDINTAIRVLKSEHLKAKIKDVFLYWISRCHGSQ